MKKTGFHFGVPIEICGKTYYIDLNREGVQEKIKPLGDKIKKALEESKKKNDVSPVAAANIMYVLEGMKIKAQTSGITEKMVDEQLTYIMEGLIIE